jgi:prepilin-type processing-associated H-X9-DG protein
VLGILGLFCALFGLTGLVLGILALVGINRSQGRLGGRGLAVAGVVLSGLFLAFQVLILPALLLPVFAQAREKARTQVCQSNLKQLAMGALMFAQDHNEKLPAAGNWCDNLSSYTKNPLIFRCPTVGGSSQCHYALNARLSQRSLATIRSPSTTVLFFEAEGGWNVSGSAQDAVFRHAGGGNIAFADGSVRWMRPEEAQGLNWEP